MVLLIMSQILSTSRNTIYQTTSDLSDQQENLGQCILELRSVAGEMVRSASVQSSYSEILPIKNISISAYLAPTCMEATANPERKEKDSIHA